MIELRHVKKAFPDVTPLSDVNAEIRKGDVISVIGPSGCGKSTLLKMINLLVKPTSGQIIVDGEDITAPGYREYEIRRKIGMVFQNYNLFEHLTVVENVMIPPMDLLGRTKQEAYDRAMELLYMVGMEKKALQYPEMLSGGQKQRVAIARTLAMEPEVILFDEPTSALDPTMVGEVKSVIESLAEKGHTMMIVTHEMKFAREIANRVFYLDEGGVYEEGTPEEIFENPEKPLTRRFIHRLKIFETQVEGSSADFAGIISEIEEYGKKIMADKRDIYRLQAVFEELCQQILLENDSDCRIKFTIEYNDSKNGLKVHVSYSGERFEPEEADNEIALTILKRRVTSMKYFETANEDFRNNIVLEM